MGNFLDKTQKKQLEEELRREGRRKLADRIRIILLLDKGWTYKKIAEAFFLDEDTIANYRRRYKEGGIEALTHDQYKGSASFLSLDDQVKLEIHLLGTVYTSIKPILNYINRKFKVTYTASGLTSLLRRMGFSYKKPKSIPGKAKIEDQKKFIDSYSKLKGNGAKIYFGDSVHPQHNPILACGWIKQGLEMEVSSHTGRHHLNIAGALCLETMEVITRSFCTINASSICQMLHAIREKNSVGNKLYFVLDNARYHRAKVVKAKAEELNIELVYLPPYSPNLNPIERLWKFFKKKVLYNTYYETFDTFKKATSSFFRGLRGRMVELVTLLTDNFTPVGT